MSKKKVDPEAQRQQFENWSNNDECRVWQELQSLANSMPECQGNDFSETSVDLTGNWQPYHDKLFELCSVFKVKSRLKSFQHEFMRTFFFAQEDKEIDKVVVKYIVDFFHCAVEKEYAVNAWNLRKKFVEIFRALDNADKLQPEDYLVKKKELTKLLSEFMKRFQAHQKTSHKHIDEKLQLVLGPLKQLLEINRKYFFFELKNKTSQDVETNNFILKALVDQYCACLQECQKILFKQDQIKFNPEVRRIFNKLNYANWSNNKIESFYLLPLKKSFDKLKLNLVCLMTKGINFYRIPLGKNEQFILDLQEMINYELIAERLLGNQLKRDQLNFMFKVLCVIFEANPLSKEYLLKKDENCLYGSIPKLTVYLTIIHMRQWLDKKAADEAKLQEEKEKLMKKQSETNINFHEQGQHQISLANQSTIMMNQSTLNQSAMNQSTMMQSTLMNQSTFFSPDKKRGEEESKRKEEIQKQMEEQIKKQEQHDQEKYGRFWVWDYYCSPEHRKLFDQCVELVRHINLAVWQDIQDEIIREGMIPRIKDRQSKELKEATENLNKLRSKDNANEVSIKKRPPELWNYPKIVEEKHEFRSIADPKKCYIDGRIEQLEKMIKSLAEHLVTNRSQSWNEIVLRCIDALNENYNIQYNLIDEGK